MTEPRTLRAGPLTAVLDGVDLRDVREGDVELFRRVHVAVRDPDWGTVPGIVTGLRVEQADDAFLVAFDVRHADGALDFAWSGTIRGSADGTVAYVLDGTARSAFSFCRIGFCVLHPDDECAGQPYSGRGPGGPVQGELPDLIAPQPFEDGVYRALFAPVSELSVGLRSGGRAHVRFEGELFEMEDQRNWTDASFKTYGTPMALGFPHHAAVGQEISQRVELSADRSAGRPVRRPGGDVALHVGGPAGSRLPVLGLGPASTPEPLSAAQVERLRAVRPEHVRVDVDLDDPAWPEALARGIDASRSLDAPLELALFLGAGDVPAELAARLAGERVARVLVFAAGAETATPEETTPPALLRRARAALRPTLRDVPVGGGTDMYFCEFNRTRPQTAEMDVVAYSIMPQEHADDDRSLVEALRPQGATVRSARAFAGGRPIVVSPITFRPRRPVHDPDPRQSSQLAAAWTAASVKHLAEAGAAAVGYFEPAGARGVVRADGAATPVHAVLAALSAVRGARVIGCASDDPLRAVGLALRAGAADPPRLLLANLTPGTLDCTVGGAAAGHAAVRAVAGDAIALPARDGMARVELDAHAVAWLEATAR